MFIHANSNLINLQIISISPRSFQHISSEVDSVSAFFCQTPFDHQDSSSQQEITKQLGLKKMGKVRRSENEFYRTGAGGKFRKYYIKQAMEERKQNQQKMVHTITDFSEMRFSPHTYPRSDPPGQTIVGKIKSFISWPLTHNVRSPVAQTPKSLSVPPSRELAQLQFVRKLTPEHVLFGNHRQLDLISLQHATETFLETEYVWSVKTGYPIELVCVDRKRNRFALGSRLHKNISVYRYDAQKIHKQPQRMSQFSLSETPLEISFLRDIFLIFYPTRLELYSLNQKSEYYLKQQHSYLFPPDLSFSLFKVPQPVDSTLSLFFTEDITSNKTFSLWMLEVEYIGKDVKVNPIQKIYDIKKSLRNKIRINNSSDKGTFMMSLGSQLLAFKKGYIVDSISINVTNPRSHLKQINDSTIVHFNLDHIDTYNYHLDFTSRPCRIQLAPRDSIKIVMPPNTRYYDALPIQNDNILVVLSRDPAANRKTKGEFNYWLAMTQFIPIEKKISSLFPYNMITELSSVELSNRIDMASKMGMSESEIYLQLWRRCQKKQVNFPLLINIRNYECIQAEVEAMLKKKSMSFLEIFKIQQSCLEMLKQSMFSPNCTKRAFFGYISCNYLIKKLEFFRDISLIRGAHGHQRMAVPFLVNVRKYYQVRDTHLINYFVSLVQDLCLKGYQVQREIKHFLNTFRLEIIPVYLEILKQLIERLGARFLILLEQIPQILPYDPMGGNHNNARIRLCSLWKPLTADEKKSAMCIDNLSTIDNAQIIREGIKDLWFRRSHMFIHCFMTETMAEIEEKFEHLNSEETFLYVIEKILQQIANPEDCKQIFTFIGAKYVSKIEHLQDRINLYNSLYSYLSEHSILPLNAQDQAYSFREFLSLRASRLFCHFFKMEKTRKGLILQEMKPIFHRHSPQDKCLFNDFLLNYFKSPISELSDIKYLLNRINNEHIEFHMESQPMYEVLVEAMTMKLMVGTDNDIPLSEILIYIENIPIKSEYLLNKLSIISAVNRNSKIMQQAGVNMSIMEIMEDPVRLMIKITDYLLDLNSVANQIEDERRLKISYVILAELDLLYRQIFKKESSYDIIFIYLVKLAEKECRVSHIRKLIEDPYLRQEFVFDQSIREALVVYLYKARLSSQPLYEDNEQYLRTLITLLPEESQIRHFIICEFQIASMLSKGNHKVQYPLSEHSTSLGIKEFEEHLLRIPESALLALNIDELSTLVCRMQDLNIHIRYLFSRSGQADNEDILSEIFYPDNNPRLTRKRIYQIYMLRLLYLKKTHELIPIMKEYFRDARQTVESDVVYVMALLVRMEGDLTPECMNLFFMAACLRFHSPEQLLSLVGEFVGSRANPQRRVRSLRREVLTNQQNLKGFNLENKVLNQRILNIAMTQGLHNNLFSLLISTFRHIHKSHADFHSYYYYFLFAALINAPYTLAQFLIYPYEVPNSIHAMRLFLSYAAKETVFDSLAILELGRRVFLIAIYCLKDQMDLEQVTLNFIDYPLEESLPDCLEPSFDQQAPHLQALFKSSIAFKKEKSSRAQKIESQVAQANIANQDAALRWLLNNPESIAFEDAVEFSGFLFEYEEEPEEGGRPKEKKIRFFNEWSFIRNFIKRKLIFSIAEQKKKQDPMLDYTNMLLPKNSEQEQQDKSNSVLGLQPSPDEKTLRKSSSGRISENEGEYAIIQTGPKMNEEEQRKKELLDSFLKEKITHATHQFYKNIIEHSPLSAKVSQDDRLNTSSPKFGANSSGGESRRDLSPDRASQARSSSRTNRSASNERIKKLDSDVDNHEATWKLTSKYSRVEGFPIVEDVGVKLHQQNLMQFQKKRSRFKVGVLEEYEKLPHFDAFINQIILFIYYENQQSSIEGVLALIELLIKKYRLPYNIEYLKFLKKGEKLFKRYNSNSKPRQSLCIEAVLCQEATPFEIFQRMKDKILGNVNQSNIYSTAKIVRMLFGCKEVQTELLFGYLLMLARIPEPGQNSGSKIERHNENLAVALDRIPVLTLSARIAQLYPEAAESEKPKIMEMILQRVKGIYKKDEKVEFLTALATYDKNARDLLNRIQK